MNIDKWDRIMKKGGLKNLPALRMCNFQKYNVKNETIMLLSPAVCSIATTFGKHFFCGERGGQRERERRRERWRKRASSLLWAPGKIRKNSRSSTGVWMVYLLYSVQYALPLALGFLQLSAVCAPCHAPSA